MVVVVTVVLVETVAVVVVQPQVTVLMVLQTQVVVAETVEDFNSDENVRERFNELREKLRRVPSGPVCDVSI